MVLLPLPGGPASASLCLLSMLLHLDFNLSGNAPQCLKGRLYFLYSLFFSLPLSSCSSVISLMSLFPPLPALVRGISEKANREPGFSSPSGGNKAPTGCQWIPCKMPKLSPPLAAMTIPPLGCQQRPKGDPQHLPPTYFLHLTQTGEMTTSVCCDKSCVCNVIPGAATEIHTQRHTLKNPVARSKWNSKKSVQVAHRKIGKRKEKQKSKRTNRKQKVKCQPILSPHRPIITLDINGLNTPIKRQTLTEWS